MRRSYLAVFSLAMALMTPSAVPAADDPGFRPIFDGKSLAGWKGDEKFWRVENGSIVGESTPEKPCKENTFLTWDQGNIDDFTLKLEFKLTGSDEAKANSGIQFRSGVKPDGHVFGYQADLDLAGQWVGACYDELGRGVLAKRGQSAVVGPDGKIAATAFGDAAELLKSVKKNDWNEYAITAQGSKLTLSINGQKTAEVDDQQKAERELSGLLALQLHSGPPQKIEFRNIRLKRHKLTDGRKKAVFVAGRPSHGPREHEHNAGCLLLAKKLDEAAVAGLPITSTVYHNGWPQDPTAFDNADTVIFYCDGGGNHYANQHLDQFDQLVQRGLGLCCIHYGVEVPKGPSGEKFLEWIGGYFEPHWSVNPHWMGKFTKFPNHPVANGVKPFEIQDEWYYHMRFRPGLEGVTPILTDLPPNDSLSRPDGPHSGNPAVREAVMVRKEPQHVAWAFERPGGKGRGFGFTGAHFHKNWQNDEFRKVVLNAVAWTAGLDVPATGIETKTPTDDELSQNLDPKAPRKQPAANKPAANKPAAPAAAQTTAAAPAAAQPGAKPAASSPNVTVNTPGHTVDIDADITGAKELFLVVTDGGDSFSCDWADWMEPRLVGPSGEKKLTDLDWKSATADWGKVGKNVNANGGPMKVKGQPVAYGIGAHANSVIRFELPAGYTRFKAKGGLDNGGTDQGTSTSVQFHVFTQAPPAGFAKAAGSSSGSHEAADAVAQLEVNPQLACTLFAAEPLMMNPTNIDIDHKGRIWVCEVVNYRRFRNGDLTERKEGDRILILEDTNFDGKADKASTFYQGRDVDSAHGILVLPTIAGPGTKALVSAGDSVFYLIDDDGDLKADRKELLFTGIAGTQHDHGIHAFVFGPDGKLYFNFGNAGERIKDKNGKPIVDKQGHEVKADGNPYREGMAFRCNLDGSEFETLGWNFRNNWELAVDSFGTIWQSDNDDDGNRGVRINYVMEFGNYGFKDEMTGASWQTPRTNLEADLPQRHWHLNDPGVIPNVLQTGNGSPTGICVYEGTLLPPQFRGALIHCDAGPNIVRAYPVKKSGAGYTGEMVNILDGAKNKWFRPSDVCVAPDGSLIIADWYDPGVGGHRMQDIDHGRLFRVAPPGTPWSIPTFDLGNPNGAVAALQNANQAWRYLGWQALKEGGAKAEPALSKMFNSPAAPTHRARAMWLLGKMDLPAEKRLATIRAGLNSPDADLRCTAVRLLREVRNDVDIASLRDDINIEDPAPEVRREFLLGLRDLQPGHLPASWAKLAQQYDGKDRWYLEALGIAAEGHWDECLAEWLQLNGGKVNTPAARDIVWRSRATQTARMLADAIGDPETATDQLPHYFRALDFQKGPDAEKAINSLAFEAQKGDEARQTLIASEAISRVKGGDLSAQPQMKASLEKVLAKNAGTVQFVRLVDRFNLTDRLPELLAMAQANPESQASVEAVKLLVDKSNADLIKKSLAGDDDVKTAATIKALGAARDNKTTPLLMPILREKARGDALRREAIAALAGSRAGSRQLVTLAEEQKYDGSLKEALAAALHGSADKEIRDVADKLFPLPPGKDNKPLPPLTELATRKGDVTNGRIVFHTLGTCIQCHIVNGLGKEVGPNLSEIGKKLTKQALWESILYPSAGISHNFDSWVVATTDGNILTGLITSETADEITMKDAKAIVRTIKKSDIEQRRKSEASLMPADLQKVISEKELVDVVEFMTTLKEAQPAAAGK